MRSSMGAKCEPLARFDLYINRELEILFHRLCSKSFKIETFEKGDLPAFANMLLKSSILATWRSKKSLKCAFVKATSWKW